MTKYPFRLADQISNRRADESLQDREQQGFCSRSCRDGFTARLARVCRYTADPGPRSRLPHCSGHLSSLPPAAAAVTTRFAALGLGIALSLGWPLPAEALECTLDSGATGSGQPAARVASSDEHVLAYRLVPDEVSVGQVVMMRGRVCRKDGQPLRGTIKASATMPRHGHGMNYSTSVAMHHDGRFEASGFVLHMPGAWQFEIRIVERIGGNSHQDVVRFMRQAG